MLRKLIAAIGALALIAGCASTRVAPAYPSHGTYSEAAPDPNLMPDTFPVYVDADFTPPQKAAIRGAVDEWNTALNGYRLYTVVDEDFRMEPSIIYIVSASGQGLLILRNKLSDYDDPDEMQGVLGYTHLYGQVIHIIADVVGTRDLKSIAAHEIGHTLGLPHVPVAHSLMWPSYPQSVSCIDRITVLSLASVNRRGWRAEHMRYCGS